MEEKIARVIKVFLSVSTKRDCGEMFERKIGMPNKSYLCILLRNKSQLLDVLKNDFV